MSSLKNEFTIGRNQGLSDIHVPSDAASDRHAKVTLLPDGLLLLEDLRSTNGTYVNGERIRTKTITLNDKVKVGEREFRLRDHFRMAPDGQIISFRPTNDFTEEFEQLRSVYDTYQTSKDRIKSQQSMHRFMRSTMPVATPLIGVIFTAFSMDKGHPFLSILPALLSAVLGLSIALILDAPFVQKRREFKINALESNHRRAFVCPKCQAPFERVSWDQVASKKMHSCGAILSR
jgi:hypothetical protein